jgi:tetratricopeptide (TPR) repeat protein
MLGDSLHSAAKADNDTTRYRSAMKRFEVAATISITAADALYNWGNVLFDLSLAARYGAPEVMTRSGEQLLRRAIAKYRDAIAKDPSFSDAHNNLANALTDLARAGYPREDDGFSGQTKLVLWKISNLGFADGTKTDKTVRNGFSFPQSTRSV